MLCQFRKKVLNSSDIKLILHSRQLMEKNSFILEVCNLDFSYGNDFRIKDVDFSLSRGEFVGVLGENGSGKTTLLRLISNILIPEEGTVKILGRDIRRYSRKELAKLISVVPQQTEVSFDFTVYEIVAMGRNPYIPAFGAETEKDIAIIKKSMEVTDSWEYRHRRVSELSAGELQRAIIARALAQEPHMLLMDEPTSALDVHQQIDLLKTLRRQNDEIGLTIVLVSHDINLLSESCSRLFLMIRGEIATDGKPSEVITSRNLKNAYRIDLTVKPSLYSGRPNVIFWDKLES